MFMGKFRSHFTVGIVLGKPVIQIPGRTNVKSALWILKNIDPILFFTFQIYDTYPVIL